MNARSGRRHRRMPRWPRIVCISRPRGPRVTAVVETGLRGTRDDRSQARSTLRTGAGGCDTRKVVCAPTATLHHIMGDALRTTRRREKTPRRPPGPGNDTGCRRDTSTADNARMGDVAGVAIHSGDMSIIQQRRWAYLISSVILSSAVGGHDHDAMSGNRLPLVKPPSPPTDYTSSSCL